MIMSKTPFRLSFVGGGTDFPDFYRKEGGGVISTTINKYVYVGVHPSFNGKIRLQYSVFEEVENVEDIQNTRIRECMKKTEVDGGIELHFLSDIPTKVGLGGSSSFTVGLLNALYAYKGKIARPETLAKEACEVEINALREPIGKQDQYISAYGGFKYIQFNRDDRVLLNHLILNCELRGELEKRLLLFYTGITRDASSVLTDQKKNIKKEREYNSLKKLNELTMEVRKYLGKEDISRFGEMLHEGWKLKKSLSKKISNSEIDKYYEKALNLGAKGGKIAGAGGGGFLLLYCEPEKQENLRRGLNDIKETPFRFTFEGSNIIYVE